MPVWVWISYFDMFDVADAQPVAVIVVCADVMFVICELAMFDAAVSVLMSAPPRRAGKRRR